MSPKRKKAWLEALRSGDYKQGAGKLREQDNGFCCLGVLCDITDNTKWKRSEFGEYLYGSADSYGFPSDAFIKRIGLGKEFSRYLARMNDNKRNFKQIADEIEKASDYEIRTKENYPIVPLE
jgi:hypothetical protein